MDSRDRAPRSLAVAALAVGLFFTTPVIYLVLRAIDLRVDAGSVLRDATDGPLQRTMLLATTVSLGAGLLGTTLAWLVIRTDVPLRKVWLALVPLPLAFPSFVAAFALVAGFAKGGLAEEFFAWFGIDELPSMRGFWAAAGVLIVFTYPYVYLPVAARLHSLPPSLEEAGRSLGLRRRETLRRLVLPQITTSVLAGMLLVALYTISEFGAVSLLRYNTLTVEIFTDALLDPSRAIGFGVVLTLLAATIVVAEGRFSQRQTQSVRHARDTRTAARLELGRWRWVGLSFCVAVTASAIGAPVVVLAHWASQGVVNDRGRLDLGELVGPAINTAALGVSTAAITVGAILPIAWLWARTRSRIGVVSANFVIVGFALPGLITALALVSAVLQFGALRWLYQSLPMLVLAYVLHFGAQAARSSKEAVGSVSPSLGEAARTLGAGPVRRFVRIDAPMMMPGLAAAAGLVLLSTVKELPATLLLAPLDFQTLATKIWSANDAGHLAQSAFASLVLLVVSGGLGWLVRFRQTS